jgi:predicted dithiol-disulfide oxidoreductase (DUF899 family)
LASGRTAPHLVGGVEEWLDVPARDQRGHRCELAGESKGGRDRAHDARSGDQLEQRRCRHDHRHSDSVTQRAAKRDRDESSAVAGSNAWRRTPRPTQRSVPMTLNLPDIVSRDEWLDARKELLAKEKRFTRERDALNADRRRLPMVEIDISNAPIEKIEAFKARMGWTFPWYSSYRSDFNYDFHVTLDESRVPFEYNYRTKAEIEGAGVPIGDWEQPFDLHGMSVFLRDGERAFHTYSAYARGTDQVGFTSQLLDVTPLGRQEEWEEPKGRATAFGAPAGSVGVRYHDEYDT